MLRRSLLVAAILATATVVGLGGFLYTDRGRSWLAEEISGRASRALGRRTELSVDRLRPHSLELSLSGVRVAGETEGGEPLLTVGRLRAKGRWPELLRGRVELADLQVSGLRLELAEMGARGPAADPQSGGHGWWLGPVVIRNLAVDGSAVSFARRDVPLELAADDLELRASWRREGAEYRGDIRVSAGRVRWPEATLDLPLSLRGNFSLSANGLALDSAEVSAPGLELAGAGEFRAGTEAAYQADLSWQASPSELPLRLPTEIDVRGAAEGEVRIRGRGSSFAADVELKGLGLAVRSVPIESASGRLVQEEGELRLVGLEARAAGLQIAGEGRLGTGEDTPRALSVAVAFHGDQPGLLLELAGMTDAKLAGSLEGQVSIEGTTESWSTLRGGYRIQARELHAALRSGQTFRVEARGGLADGVAELEALEVVAPGFGLSASGRWRPSGWSELEGNGAVSSWRSTAELIRDLGFELDSPWAARLDEVEGALAADFELSALLDGDLDRRQVGGSIELRSGGLTWAHRPDFEVTGSLRLLVDRGEPTLERGRLEAPGVSVRINGRRDPMARWRYAVGLEMEEISPTASVVGAFLARSSTDGGSSSWARRDEALGRLAGSLSLAGSVSGLHPDARIEDLSGAFDLALGDVSLGSSVEGGLSLTMSSTFAEAGLNIGRLEALMAGVEARASGRLDRGRADELVLEVAAPELSGSVERLRSLLEELGLGGDWVARIPLVSGALRAAARASGPWLTPDVHGHLTVGELEVAEHDLGALVVSIDTRGEVLAYSGRLEEEGREVEVGGEIELGDERRTTLRGRIDRQPLAPFAELAGLGGSTSGEIEGRVEMAWPEKAGLGSLTLIEAVVAGLPVERLEAEWTLEPEALEIVRGEMRAVGGALSFEGRLGPSSEPSTIRLAGQGFQIGELVAAFDLPVDVSGTVGLAGQVSGGIEEPLLEARIETVETRLLKQRTPDLIGPVRLDRSGLKVDLSSTDEAASILWMMGFAADGLWSGALEYPVRVALDPWLSGSPVGRESIVEGVLRGELQMPTGRPELAIGRLRLDDARVSAAGYPMRLDGGLEAVLDSQAARLLPFRLRGEGTELAVEAEWHREPTPSMSLEAKGRIDLRSLQALSPGLKTSGAATVDLDAAGAWPGFDWRGTVTVRDGAVQHLDFPAAVSNLGAQVEMGPSGWILRQLDARLGGGSLSAHGDLAMEGFRPGDYRIEITGDSVRLDYPEGFRSQLDADLVFARSGKGAAELSGQVTVLRGLYDRDVGIERSILARQRGLDTAVEVGRSWTDLVTLGLTLQAPEGLWVRNDLASIETRGELKVQGTLSRPRVSGRIEALEGGRIFFREVSYYVTQGSFDYLGESIDDPRLGIRAETSVSEYDVTLTVSGRLSEPVFELTSSPSLPTADIVTLLVTGSTRDQFVAGSGGLSQAQAAAYLSSGVTKRLEASLRQSLGLDEVKLDPVLVEGQTNPTARVTVGKAITPRLHATYSSRLGSAQRDVYQAKFRLNRRLNLIGTRDDDGSLSADLRYVSSRLQRSAATGAATGSGAGERPTIREIEISGNTLAHSDTLSKLLNLRIGEEFRKARLLEGLERVRGWYLDKRRPEVDTAYRVLETDSGVRLEIGIAEGREVRLRFDGFEQRKRLERPVLELWSKSLFREDIVRDAGRRVVDILAQDGYVSARAEGRLLSPAPGVAEAVFSIEPGPRARVARIALQGHAFLDEERIREQILTRRSRWRASWLNPRLVAEDAEAIRALYATLGFLEAEVRFQVGFPESDRRAAVTFVIEEGRRYALRSLRFSGNAEVSTPDLERDLGISIGEAYRDEAMRAGQLKIEKLYDGLGFPDSRVAIDVGVDRDAAAVDLSVAIEEGARLRLEAFEIDNAGITRESVIRREIRLAAGEPLRREELDATQYRLYRTGLFRSVRVDRLPGVAADTPRLRVSLEEARNLRKEYGLGWDSEEGPRVTANIAHTNFAGRRFHVGAGGRWSPVDQRLQLFLRNPSMGGSRVAGLVSAFWEDEERENFDAVRTGFSLQLGREYRDGRISANLGYDFADLEETPTVAGAMGAPVANELTQLGSLRFGVARNTRDSSFWPTTGSYARAEVSLFHSALASEAEFARLFVQWSRYSRALGDGVWSVGLRSGVAKPFGASGELPISERYFAGGETSIRGFALDSLIASGTPPQLMMNLAPGESFGGDALLVLNQEVTHRIRGPLHGLVFYDVGNLYWRLGDFDPTDLRHSAGLGLRVESPFGPIRLEYGWKLDRRRTESAGQIHFSLGLAF